MLTPERRAELREYATEWLDVSAVNIFPDVLLALLDAADERDALAAVAREADQMHAVMLAAEGELLGDSPELPRWERLLLNGLTLPELAKDAADERDRLAAQVERVRALAYVSDDGTRYGHDGHSPIDGYPECPGCWADGIIATLDGSDDE